MHSFFHRVHQLDTLAFLWVHVTKQFPYRKSIRRISRTGDGPLYGLAALAILPLEAGAAFVSAGMMAYGIDVSLYLVLKNVIKRDRPAVKLEAYQPWITPSDQFSFPSGHTAGAFLFAGLVAIFYPAFAPFCYLWACLIGASRVLLGVHYPSDIAAGALLGSGSALLGVYLQTLLGA
jgi:undecaprenyl-diphosphatase